MSLAPVEALRDPSGIVRAEQLSPQVSGAVQSDRTTVGKTEGGFSELVDILNPLQHIPGVAQIYRSVTGDEISDGARAGGNMLYGILGGPIGFMVMTGVTIAEQAASNMKAASGEEASSLAEIGPVATDPVADPTAGEPIDLAQILGNGGGIPLPSAKPDGTPAGEGLSPDVPLGVNIGRTGSEPAVLHDVLPPLRPTAGPEDMKVPASEPAADPVAAVEDLPEVNTVVTTPEGLDALNRHSANVLPLDVLKALQERYSNLEQS